MSYIISRQLRFRYPTPIVQRWRPLLDVIKPIPDSAVFIYQATSKTLRSFDEVQIRKDGDSLVELFWHGSRYHVQAAGYFYHDGNFVLWVPNENYQLSGRFVFLIPAGYSEISLKTFTLNAEILFVPDGPIIKIPGEGHPGGDKGYPYPLYRTVDCFPYCDIVPDKIIGCIAVRNVTSSLPDSPAVSQKQGSSYHETVNLKSNRQLSYSRAHKIQFPGQRLYELYDNPVGQ